MLEFWDLIVKSNTFNFIVMLVIIGIIAQKIKLADKLEAMRNEISNYIETSKHQKEAAQNYLETTRHDLANLQNDIDKKLKNAKVSAQNVFNEINEMTTKTIEKIENNVEKIIDNETQKLSSAISSETAKNAINLAKTKLQKMFEENPSLHKQHITQSINTIDKIEI